MKSDIVFAGIGGQGTIVASDIFCEAALLDSFDVAKAETHGMAQRGGSVIIHVRIGNHVLNPVIEMGTGDIILGFEILESVRSLPLLKDKGTLIINKHFIPPIPVIQRQTECPNIDRLMDAMRSKARKVYEIDGINLARKAGSIASMNIVLLGALSTIPENPVNEKSLLAAISNYFKPKYIAVNLKAFQLGRESASLS